MGVGSGSSDGEEATLTQVTHSLVGADSEAITRMTGQTIQLAQKMEDVLVAKFGAPQSATFEHKIKAASPRLPASLVRDLHEFRQQRNKAAHPTDRMHRRGLQHNKALANLAARVLSQLKN